jgi:peptidoglycan/xylan/chitin deacetylase (PgdA/CDA1 family)
LELFVVSRSTLLRTCFDVLHYSGAAAVLKPFFAGAGVVFCLHRVMPGGGVENGFAPNANLAISPQFLSDIIQLVKARGYDLIHLHEVGARLSSPQAKPFAVFTLDDGYLDNLVHAMPVFRKQRCPFTVFVAPHITDGKCEMWWSNLEAIIAASSTLDGQIEGADYQFETRNDAEKYAAWSFLAPKVQAMPEHDQREWILREADKARVDVYALCRAAAMTWDDVRLMAADPLATIGAHTLNHYNLLKLDAEDAQWEMEESKCRIEEEIGKSIETFAYPYGNSDAAGPREFALAADAGFKASVTTRHGVVFQTHADHMQALPRLMVSGRFQKTRYIETMITGMSGALSNRFQKVNVS